MFHIRSIGSEGLEENESLQGLINISIKKYERDFKSYYIYFTDEFGNRVNAFVVKYFDVDGDGEKDADEYVVNKR